MAPDDNTGLFGQLKSLVDDEVSGSQPTRDEQDKIRGEIVRPTNEDVLDEAVENVVEQRQIEKFSRDSSFDNPNQVPVELEIGDPEEVVSRIQDDLKSRHDKLLVKLDEIVKKEENSVTGSEVDTMLYVIEKSDSKNGVSILGGAESLLRNVANDSGLTRDEKELVVEAHAEAARENGFDRHLLLDCVAFVPQSGE